MRQADHPGDKVSHTRKKILRAAIHEFSRKGLAGARMDAIAQAAAVNKALLYYYYGGKSSLYAAALKEVASNVIGSALTALALAKTPGEGLLRLALNHFDRILTQREFQSLMQQEMVRVHRGETSSLELFAGSVFRPLLVKTRETIRQGVRTGELCNLDWQQVIYSGLGANVFYFLSAPMMRLALDFDPLAPAALRARRKSAVRFLGIALFQDRNHGAKLAEHVLASTPVPKIKGLSIGRRYS